MFTPKNSRFGKENPIFWPIDKKLTPKRMPEALLYLFYMVELVRQKTKKEERPAAGIVRVWSAPGKRGCSYRLRLYPVPPELGVDGKAIASFAKRRGSNPADNRGEHDANWGNHSHFFQNAAGQMEKAVKKWFGFTLHLIADSAYELPVAFSVTRASRSEVRVTHKMVNVLSREVRA